jgi:hypothetical protein
MMSADDLQERLKQIIEEQVVDHNHESVAISEGARLHVNCYAKKRQRIE